MRTVTVSSGDFAARPSLYRAWVPLHNDRRAPRVSIWMDPPLTAFGLPQEQVQILSQERRQMMRADLLQNTRLRFVRVAVNEPRGVGGAQWLGISSQFA